VVVPVVVPVVPVVVVPVVLVPVVVPVVPVVVVVACPQAGNANTKRKVRATKIVRKYSTGIPCSLQLSHLSVDNRLSVQTMQVLASVR
jgi:hypothetical protein